METGTTRPPDGSDAPEPGPGPGPHPSEYLPPARLAEWYADLEALAAERGLPPLPIPEWLPKVPPR